VVRKSVSELTVDQVVRRVMAMIVVGVFIWLWLGLRLLAADDQFRELVRWITRLSMTSYGLR
jgi:hypothetical protein